MHLLSTEAYRDALAISLGISKISVVVLSAFVTKGGCEWIERHLLSKGVDVQLIARWKPMDLVSGASDLASYEFAREHGWSFNVHPSLHGKVICVDDERMHVGSANVTTKGLALAPGGNREFGVSFTSSQRDKDVIQSVQDECVNITPELFMAIKKYVEKLQDEIDLPSVDDVWPINIQSSLLSLPSRLWVADMPWLAPDRGLTLIQLFSGSGREVEHDVRLFGFLAEQTSMDISVLKSTFMNSQAYMWLIHLLRKAEKHELYFGALSAALHDSLLDDPAPYRKDVKELLSNLLKWIEYLEIPEVKIDVPGRHSQRVSLVTI